MLRAVAHFISDSFRDTAKAALQIKYFILVVHAAATLTKYVLLHTVCKQKKKDM